LFSSFGISGDRWDQIWSLLNITVSKNKVTVYL